MCDQGRRCILFPFVRNIRVRVSIMISNKLENRVRIERHRIRVRAPGTYKNVLCRHFLSVPVNQLVWCVHLNWSEARPHYVGWFVPFTVLRENSCSFSAHTVTTKQASRVFTHGVIGLIETSLRA